jgi:hypothetical protein
MGCAEVIALDQVRAGKQWATLRQQLHESFDRWLDELETRLSTPQPTLTEVTQVVWDIRHRLTGSVTEAIVIHRHQQTCDQSYASCPRCAHRVKHRGRVLRTLGTLVGPVEVSRPYFYCGGCRYGFYPLDAVLALAPGRQQYDVQQAAAKLVAEVPYETAHVLFGELTGVAIGTERMHGHTNALAEGLSILDVAPSPEEVLRKVSAVRTGTRRPIMVLAIDGAFVPTRPDSAHGSRPGRNTTRAKRARWRGQWRDAKGFRMYLLDGDRIMQVLSWHQLQDEQAVGDALQQVKEAGLIPEEQVRLCVVADGAKWIWKHVKALFPSAVQVLDYYHCAEHLYDVAKQHYGASLHAQQWTEATITRLFEGQVHLVIGGLKRMQAASEAVANAIENLTIYLDDHRDHVNYGTKRRAGYPLGSGGIASANKFICHVRLKRSGAWWYAANSNQMLALRCAKYNGTFERVFAHYRQRQLETKK